jgi:hypothetical protein
MVFAILTLKVGKNLLKASDDMGKIVISEVSQKQAYIFRTNRQKENIGASYIIKAVTEDKQKDFVLKNHGEIVYAGGGKSLCYFKDGRDAENFAMEYSLRVLKEFSGLELFIASQDYDPKNDKATEKVKAVHQALGCKKTARETSVRQTGFGVAQNDYVLESRVKEEYAKAGKQVGSELLCGSLADMSFTNGVDELVKNNEADNGEKEAEKNVKKSYIAVVHIDGNSMGMRFENIRAKYDSQYIQDSLSNEAINDDYLNECQAFSREIKEVYQAAFREMLEIIKRNIDADSEFPHRKAKVLPIIPLIIAGDDITFLCAAEIALECIRVFLNKLETKQSGIDKDNFYACGGAAIIRNHYPFFAAYELAEKLCGNAKIKVRGYNKNKKMSAMDWHIVQGECDDINEMRQRVYYIDNSNDRLYMRPLIVTGNPTPEHWEHYQNFTAAMKIITDGKMARSKVKQLRTVLRRGKVYTENFLRANQLAGRFITLDQSGRINCQKYARAIGTGQNAGVQEYLGFHENTCLYFDALEMMDLFYQLN